MTPIYKPIAWCFEFAGTLCTATIICGFLLFCNEGNQIPVAVGMIAGYWFLPIIGKSIRIWYGDAP